MLAAASGLERGRCGQRSHEALLTQLNAAVRLDWSRAVVDPSHVRALKGDSTRAPSPVDRSRPGSKHHLITDGHGTPLAAILTGGNCGRRHSTPAANRGGTAIRGRRGHHLRKPDSLFADRGYDHGIYRGQVGARRIAPAIARPGTGLGTYHWVVERTFAWLHGFKRLRTRWEQRAESTKPFSMPCPRPGGRVSPGVGSGKLPGRRQTMSP